MKYLLCEITSDDNLVVIDKDLTEDQVKSQCSWSDKYQKKNLILIPHKTVDIKVTNYGNDIEVKILG